MGFRGILSNQHSSRSRDKVRVVFEDGSTTREFACSVTGLEQIAKSRRMETRPRSWQDNNNNDDNNNISNP